FNINQGTQTSNQNITNDDFNIKEIHIGRQTWGGSVPNFISKLKNLETLYIGDASASTSYNGITSWGNFSGATNINYLGIFRLPSLSVNIPSWVSSLTNLKEIDFRGSTPTLTRANGFVDSLYDFVVLNASMS